jgi:hypothetical protein
MPTTLKTYQPTKANIKKFLKDLWRQFAEEDCGVPLFVDLTWEINDEFRPILAYLVEHHNCGYYETLKTMVWLSKIYA